MGRMEIKIQFCPTIWESDSGERIGQGSFRCASSLAPVRVAAGFRSLQGHVEARSGERIGLGTLQVRVEPRSSARRGALQVSVGARFRVVLRSAQVRVEPRSSARRGALQVRVGARFRSLRGKLQGLVKARSGERIGKERFRSASL